MEENGNGKGSSCLLIIVGILLVGMLGYGATTLFRTAGENNNNQRKADVSLNDYVAKGRDLPVGKYVSLDVRFVGGPYATNTHTETTNWIFTATSAVDNYYAVMLDDGTIMAVCASNKAEKEKLDKLVEWWNSVEGMPMTGEVLHLQGDLKEMTEKNDNERDLMDYYKSFLRQANVSLSSPKVHYLVLDTRAGRDSIWMWIGGGVLVLILILWIRSRSKKKKAAASSAEAPAA
jgi:hypothetical protein